MRLTLAILAGLALLPTGCGDSGGGQPAVPADFALTLQRRACYGPCPVYSVDVDASGAVRYRGEYYVRVIGEAESRIGARALGRIAAALDDVDFFSLEDQYFYFGPGCEQVRPDSQSVIVTATRNGVTQRINHYFGCHSSDPVLDELVDMQLEIDDALNTQQWVLCTEDDTFFTTHCVPFP